MAKQPYSEVGLHPLAVPLEAPAGITTSANTLDPEGDTVEIRSSREINPDGHNQSIGRDNVFSV
jgi:hypothetical protein